MPNRSGSSAAHVPAALQERELRAAHEIARAFLAASHPKEVYRLALTRLAPVVNADFAAVFLRDDDDRDALRPIVVHGWPQASAIFLGQLRIRVGRGPTGMAVAANTAVEVENVFADDRLAEWWQPARELGFTAMISLPLCAEYDAIGALSFYFAGARVFNAEERRLLQLIAEQLAATAARINVVDSLRVTNHRLERENETLLKQFESSRQAAKQHDVLMLDVAHDLSRALRSVQDAAHAGRAGDTLSAAAAMARILADVITLHSLRLGRTRSESAPEDAMRLARIALEEARPFAAVPIDLRDDELVIPIFTDGASVVKILSALATCALQSTVRGEASMAVERDEDEIVWTLRVRGLGLEQPVPARRPNGVVPRFRSSLDMTLAQERAASLGGRIVVASDPADGQTFALRLPSRPPRRR